MDLVEEQRSMEDDEDVDKENQNDDWMFEEQDACGWEEKTRNNHAYGRTLSQNEAHPPNDNNKNNDKDYEKEEEESINRRPFDEPPLLKQHDPTDAYRYNRTDTVTKNEDPMSISVMNKIYVRYGSRHDDDDDLDYEYYGDDDQTTKLRLANSTRPNGAKKKSKKKRQQNEVGSRRSWEDDDDDVVTTTTTQTATTTDSSNDKTSVATSRTSATAHSTTPTNLSSSTGQCQDIAENTPAMTNGDAPPMIPTTLASASLAYSSSSSSQQRRCPDKILTEDDCENDDDHHPFLSEESASASPFSILSQVHDSSNSTEPQATRTMTAAKPTPILTSLSAVKEAPNNNDAVENALITVLSGPTETNAPLWSSQQHRQDPGNMLSSLNCTTHPNDDNDEHPPFLSEQSSSSVPFSHVSMVSQSSSNAAMLLFFEDENSSITASHTAADESSSDVDTILDRYRPNHPANKSAKTSSCHLGNDCSSQPQAVIASIGSSRLRGHLLHGPQNDSAEDGDFDKGRDVVCVIHGADRTEPKRQAPATTAALAMTVTVQADKGVNERAKQYQGACASVPLSSALQRPIVMTSRNLSTSSGPLLQQDAADEYSESKHLVYTCCSTPNPTELLPRRAATVALAVTMQAYVEAKERVKQQQQRLASFSTGVPHFSKTQQRDEDSKQRARQARQVHVAQMAAIVTEPTSLSVPATSDRIAHIASMQKPPTGGVGAIRPVAIRPDPPLLQQQHTLTATATHPYPQQQRQSLNGRRCSSARPQIGAIASTTVNPPGLVKMQPSSQQRTGSRKAETNGNDVRAAVPNGRVAPVLHSEKSIIATTSGGGGSNAQQNKVDEYLPKSLSWSLSNLRREHDGVTTNTSTRTGILSMPEMVDSSSKASSLLARPRVTRPAATGFQQHDHPNKNVSNTTVRKGLPPPPLSRTLSAEFVTVKVLNKEEERERIRRQGKADAEASIAAEAAIVYDTDDLENGGCQNEVNQPSKIKVYITIAAVLMIIAVLVAAVLLVRLGVADTPGFSSLGGGSCDEAFGPLNVTSTVNGNIDAVVVGTNRLATPDNDFACQAEIEEGGFGLWYFLDGPGHRLSASTCEGTDFATQVLVFAAAGSSPSPSSCGGLECIGGSDQFPAGVCGAQSAVGWLAEKGTQYYILVHGFRASSTGTFRLSIEKLQNNDECTDAIPMVAADQMQEDNETKISTPIEPIPEMNSAPVAVMFGSTRNSTTNVLDNCMARSAGDSSTGGGTTIDSPSAWYTMEGDGRNRCATLSSQQSVFDAQLSIFKGTGCGRISCAPYVITVGSEYEQEATWHTEPGLPYYLVVHGTEQSQTGDFFLSLRTPPSNYLCETASELALNGSSIVFGTTENACLDETIDCSGSRVAKAPGVWYIIVGTGNRLSASTCETRSGFVPQLSVFVGRNCSSLECVEDATEEFCGDQTTFTWSSVPGARYYLLVQAFELGTGDFNLTLTDVKPQVSDTCNIATTTGRAYTELVVNGESLLGSTFDATRDVVPICGSAADDFNYQGVWYTVNGSGTELTASTCNSGTIYPSRMSIFTGRCNSLQCVDTSVATCDGQAMKAAWRSIAQQPYYILIHGSNSSHSPSSGAFVLTVEDRGLGPTNDFCVSAEDLSYPTSLLSSTANATTDYAAPSCGNNANVAPGVWYRVMGGGNRLTASLCSDRTTYDTQLYVYTGRCDALVCVAADDDGCNPQSTLTWDAAQDEVYYLFISGFREQCDFELILS